MTLYIIIDQFLGLIMNLYPNGIYTDICVSFAKIGLGYIINIETENDKTKIDIYTIVVACK